jgi:cytochrome c5
VTYTIEGKQYIAVGSGGRAAPTTTLGRLVGVDVPQGSGVVWVFALPDDEPRTVPRPTRRDRPARSLGDRVFTANQASQGKALFAQECDTCHEIENYTGANFAAKWGGGTLADVYQDFALAMPPANAGGLTPATYASIVAFFASESGYPPGNVELPGDATQLRGIAIGEGDIGPSP